MKYKDSETIQAQIATFATERKKKFINSEHLHNNVIKLSKQNPSDQSRITNHSELIENENTGEIIRLEKGSQRKVATKDEYIGFLREVEGSKYSPILERARVLTNYKTFAPKIKILKQELSEMSDQRKHSSFMGDRANARVYKITVENKNYAVRIPNGQKVNPASVDEHLAGSALSRDVPHLEQIIAASYADGVTVAEIMPGKEIGKLENSSISNIKEQHLVELIATLKKANARGITIDSSPSNIFYSPEDGFGIIDFVSNMTASYGLRVESLGKIVSLIAMVFSNAGRDRSNRKGSEASARLENERQEQKLKLIKKYRSVISKELSGKDLTEALTAIDYFL